MQKELEGNISLITESELSEILGQSKVNKVLSEEECLRVVSSYYIKYINKNKKIYEKLNEKQIKNDDNSSEKKRDDKITNTLKTAGKNINVCFLWKEDRIEVEINEKITAQEAIKELMNANVIPKESIDLYYLQVLGGKIFSKKLSFLDAGVKNGDFIKVYKKEYE